MRLKFLIVIVCVVPLISTAAFADFISARRASATWKDDAIVNPVQALGRVFFSESGWNSPADQHLIVAVYERRLSRVAPDSVKRRSYGMQLVWIAKRYSTKTFRPREVVSVPRGYGGRSRRQTWLNDMGPSCNQPEGWPLLKRDGSPYPPWRTFRSRCKVLFDRANDFVFQRKPGVCTSSIPVDHWGGAMDDHRAHRNNWIQVTDWKCVEDGKEYTPKNNAWCNPRISNCFGNDRTPTRIFPNSKPT